MAFPKMEEAISPQMGCKSAEAVLGWRTKIPPKVLLAANPALLTSWAHANSATKLVEVYWQ